MVCQSVRNALYHDSNASPMDRAQNLLSLMTLPEKAGLLFHSMSAPHDNISTRAPVGFDLPSPTEFVADMHMTHLSILGPINDARKVAKWHNEVQKFAYENTRLGIPVTFSSDPRHHFTENIGTSFTAGRMSQWPETLGLAALRDIDLVEKFADIVRQEYLAVGKIGRAHV